jgi:hypothetical protein
LTLLAGLCSQAELANKDFSKKPASKAHPFLLILRANGSLQHTGFDIQTQRNKGPENNYSLDPVILK